MSSSQQRPLLYLKSNFLQLGYYSQLYDPLSEQPNTNTFPTLRQTTETASPVLFAGLCVFGCCSQMKVIKAERQFCFFVVVKSDSAAHPSCASQQLLFRPATSAGRSVAAPKSNNRQDHSLPRERLSFCRSSSHNSAP